MPRCQYCAYDIQDTQQVCEHCGMDDPLGRDERRWVKVSLCLWLVLLALIWLS